MKHIKKNIKKSRFVIIACIIFLLVTPVNASAKSLAQSFSGGRDYVIVSMAIQGNYYKKTAWAQTYGYYNYSRKHYVRAYIGGSSSSASNAIADTGRRYSYGNVYAKCTTPNSVYIPSGNSPYACYFPTAYAKYGSN